MSVALPRPQGPAPALSFVVPGLGQLLTNQVLLGVQYLVAAALLWALCWPALTGAGTGIEARVLAALTLLALHVGAGLTAIAGGRRLAGVGDPAAAGKTYRLWSTVIAGFATALVAALFLRWAITLPSWPQVWRNVPLLLVGTFRSSQYAEEHWRLWGFAVLGAGGLLSYFFSLARVRFAWAWLALAVAVGAFMLLPTVFPDVILGGLALSLVLAILGIVLSLPVGILFGIGRTSEYPFIRTVSGLYVELFRGIPFVAVIFWFFIFVPYVLGQGTQFTAVVMALALFTGAYVAEIVRAGLRALPRGQNEAARALGLSGTQTMLQVVLPQAVRNMVPPLVGQFISLFKDTSLTSIVSFNELFGAGRGVANRLSIATFEVYLTVAVLYFVFAYALSLLASKLETPKRR